MFRLIAVALAAFALLLPAATAAPVSVTVAQSTLTIPCGSGVRAATDWFLPSVTPTGVVWLQHAYLNTKADVAALGAALARTGAIVVSPSVSNNTWDPCWIDSTALHRAVAQLFVDRAPLVASARAAGWTLPLPAPFVLTGHSSGGNLALAAAGHLAGTAAFASLRAVVMYDGASQDASQAQAAAAYAALSGPNWRPVLQIAAPPTTCNPQAVGTRALLAARPGQFVGVELLSGQHLDASGYSGLGWLYCGWPRPENVQAVQTIASQWVTNALTGSAGGIVGGAPGQAYAVGAATAYVLPR